ncbi:MAG: DegQ family serine endoprotease [Burkholderiaceae bacterium]|nr:DegQ family serine endoprotease [Burkholderiaceae bacterium]
MNLKYLTLGLAAFSLAAAGSCSAFSLDPSTWLSKDKQSTHEASNAGSTAPPAAVPPAPVAPLPANAVPNYRAIVQQSGPAVVGVTVEGSHQTELGKMPPGMEDPFFQFFRGLPGFEGRLPWPRQGGERAFRGQGSGFILSSDGLILTNAHVVRNAKEVTVKLSDRREFKAKVLGADPATDVAVLRIDAKNLPVVRLGDVRQLQVGDPVLAIGSPFGFEQTATQGIVSAKGRSLPGDTAVPFIQTDAAVNPGNSGGPLFDGTGAVVGINAQIYSRSGGYQGLSFAIPINVALKVKDQIVATGKASHARLGVTIQDLNQTLAESFGLAKPDGALIASVSPDTAAAGAGLKSGDVITEVNGEPIVRSGDLSSRIGLATPGETVRLKFWRDKSPREISVKLGRAEENKDTVGEGDSDAQPGQLGLALRALTPEERSRSGLDEGLLVERVSGPSVRAGVVPGDVLVAINGQRVNSIKQVRRVMEQKPKSVALLVERKDGRIFIPVNLGK